MPSPKAPPKKRSPKSKTSTTSKTATSTKSKVLGTDPITVPADFDADALIEAECNLGNSFFDLARAMGATPATIVGAIASMFAAMCVRANVIVSDWEREGHGLIDNDMRIGLLVEDIKMKIAGLEQVNADGTDTEGNGGGGGGEKTKTQTH